MPKIKITELEQQARNGYPFSFELPAEEIQPVLDNCHLLEPIQVHGTIIDLGNEYEITGEIEYNKSFICDCCLSKVNRKQQLAFSEKLMKPLNVSEQESDLLKGDFLDITDLVRDTIVVAQPISNLCKDDCRGLCPKCGADLNKGDCGCSHEVIDERLAILKSLLNNNDGTDV